MNFKNFFLFRYMSWIAVISSLIGSSLMFIIGGYKTYLAVGNFLGFVKRARLEDASVKISPSNLSIATMVSAMDTFLFALVLLIFAYGVFHLFIATGDKIMEASLPEWARIESVTQLKTILAQVIIVILFVDFLESVISSGLEWMPWEGLTTPLAVLFLAGALRLMHTKE
jgi:uncharacterized membrane protein YqhA